MVTCLSVCCVSNLLNNIFMFVKVNMLIYGLKFLCVICLTYLRYMLSKKHGTFICINEFACFISKHELY